MALPLQLNAEISRGRKPMGFNKFLESIAPSGRTPLHGAQWVGTAAETVFSEHHPEIILTASFSRQSLIFSHPIVPAARHSFVEYDRPLSFSVQWDSARFT